MRIPPAIVAPLINVVYRVWCSTLRIREFGRDTVDAFSAEGKPMMFALWHNEVFPLMYTRRTLRIVAVVSQSRDGEYLARLLQALGIKTARGSSSRGGIGALLNAARLMREQKYSGCITVDGPRGPRHVVKQGAVVLAFRTPAYVVPIRLFAAKAKEFRSWDRFRLPLPFSRVDIVFGEPYLLSAEKLSESELERERLELEGRLHSLAAPDAARLGKEGGHAV